MAVNKEKLVADTLNTISAESNMLGRAPNVTDEASIRAYGEFITSDTRYIEEFSGLIKRIFEVRVWNIVWESPLSFLFSKQDWGESIEEIFVNTAKVFGYDPYGKGEEQWKRVPPDTRAAIHRMNAKFTGEQTVYDINLRQCFLSFDSFYNYFSGVIAALLNGINLALYQAVKYVVARAMLSTNAAGVAIPSNSEPQEYTKKLKEITSKLTFLSDKYNAAGVDSFSPMDMLYLLVTPEFDATQEVDVLAYMFQIEKGLLPYRKIVIDSWTDWRYDYLQEVFVDGVEQFTEEELAKLARIQAVLMDKRAVIAYDMLTTSEVARNKLKLYENYFVHIFATISFSPFANMVIFAEGDEGTEVSSWKNPYGELDIKVGRDNRFYARPAIAHGTFTPQENVFPIVAGDGLIKVEGKENWYTASMKRGDTATLTYAKPANGSGEMQDLVINVRIV